MFRGRARGGAGWFRPEWGCRASPAVPAGRACGDLATGACGGPGSNRERDREREREQERRIARDLAREYQAREAELHEQLHTLQSSQVLQIASVNRTCPPIRGAL